MNRLYQLAEEKLLSAEVDWITDDIKCVLVDTDDYTVDFDLDEFLDDIPGGAVEATSANLTGKGVTTGVATADDAVFSLVTGDQCEAVVIYKDTGVAGTSPLIAYLDTLTGLPVTPSGGNITVVWDAGVVFYLTDLQEGLQVLSVEDEAAREALDVTEGTLVWQEDTNEYWTLVDGATPYWDLVWPVVPTPTPVIKGLAIARGSGGGDYSVGTGLPSELSTDLRVSIAAEVGDVVVYIWQANTYASSGTRQHQVNYEINGVRRFTEGSYPTSATPWQYNATGDPQLHTGVDFRVVTSGDLNAGSFDTKFVGGCSAASFSIVNGTTVQPMITLVNLGPIA